MTAQLGLRSSLGYFAHALLLSGAIGLLFLQRYLWLLKIAQQGYGPYQTVTYLAGISAVVVLVDLAVLMWASKGSLSDKTLSILWPAFFFCAALFLVVSNNL